MKKLSKRIIAAVSSLLLVLSFALPAFANPAGMGKMRMLVGVIREIDSASETLVLSARLGRMLSAENAVIVFIDDEGAQVGQFSDLRVGDRFRAIAVKQAGRTNFNKAEAVVILVTLSLPRTIAGGVWVAASTLQFSSQSSTASVNAVSVSIPVRLSRAIAVDVWVSYRVLGGAQGDETISSGVVLIPAGQTSADIDVSLPSNRTSNTLVIKLSSPMNALLGPLATHTLTIGS